MWARPGREQPSVPLRICGLIGLQITVFNHKDHKGLAKVNPVLDSPMILWCGLCVLCALCGLWLFAELFGCGKAVVIVSVPLWMGQSIAVHHRGKRIQRICDSSPPVLNSEEPKDYLVT